MLILVICGGRILGNLLLSFFLLIKLFRMSKHGFNNNHKLIVSENNQINSVDQTEREVIPDKVPISLGAPGILPVQA